ncbi:DnaJ C-terminal domain-containing protein [Pseudonocardia sp. CA-107938]|uniref:DnaJ C-terminal domain-containing protein n=1 Tax=Pseudonocardia sp. CA-107938 TaxID=3240021 RepID=UPI003D8D35F1
MAARDHYAVLGVARAATGEEIQRAYRALVRRFHPDVNAEPGSEEQFHRVREAYAVLSDAARRARYDRDDTPSTGARRVHVNIRRPRRSAGVDSARADTEVEVELQVEELYTGARRRVTLSTTTASRVHEVAIPAGVTDGDRVRVPGENLYLIVRVAPHPRYRVAGRDVTLRLPVAPWEAALGAELTVPTPSGPIAVELPPGSSSGRLVRLRGRGVPNPGGQPGDLYVEVAIAVPPSPTPAERQLYEQLAATSRFDPRSP